MSTLLPFIVSGLVSGTLYGLAGVGLVLTFRTSGVFNFGHGSVAAGAAYLFYTLHFDWGWPWPVAAVLTVGLFVVVVGPLIDRLTRGLSNAAPVVVVVGTVGILLLCNGLLNVQYGSVALPFPPFLPTSGFTVAGVNVSWAQVISAGVATGSVAALYLYLGRSRRGVAMRAVVDHPELIGLTGLAPDRVRRQAWSIGAGFAALSGILLAPVLGLDVLLLTLLVVQAFGACAIGLFKSLPLTYLGGLLVGLAISLATRYLTAPPWTGVPSAMPFIILVGVLIAVPAAKFPNTRVVPKALTSRLDALSVRRSAPRTAVGIAVLLVLPHVVGSKLPVWIAGMGSVVLLGSLALLVWVAGQMSLCHMAFAAIGATTLAHLRTEHGVPWVPAVLLAGLAAVPAGALVAIPAIRLSGLYLALATFGFGVLMQNVVFGLDFMFGASGTAIVTRPSFAGFDGNDDTTYYYMALAFAALSCVAFVLLGRSRLGRLLRALAEAPTSLTTQGLSVTVTRFLAFCISAMFAGIAGALLVTQSGSASGVTFGPVTSLLLIAVLAIAGTRLLRGTIVSALAFSVVPAYVQGFGLEQQMLVFGVLAVVASMVLSRADTIRTRVASLATASEARLGTSPVSARSAPRRGPLAEVPG